MITTSSLARQAVAHLEQYAERIAETTDAVELVELGVLVDERVGAAAHMKPPMSHASPHEHIHS